MYWLSLLRLGPVLKHADDLIRVELKDGIDLLLVFEELEGGRLLDRLPDGQGLVLRGVDFNYDDGRLLREMGEEGKIVGLCR